MFLLRLSEPEHTCAAKAAGAAARGRSAHATRRAFPGRLSTPRITTTVVAAAAVSRRGRRKRHSVHLVGP